MTACDQCKLALWTNGLERFFLRNEMRGQEVRFVPMGGWPGAAGAVGTCQTPTPEGVALSKDKRTHLQRKV